jgi:hypothetical protein
MVGTVLFYDYTKIYFIKSQYSRDNMCSTSYRLDYFINNAISIVIGLLTGIIVAETFNGNYTVSILGICVILAMCFVICCWKPAFRSKYSPGLFSGGGTGLITGVIISALLTTDSTLIVNKSLILFLGFAVAIIFVILPIGYYFKYKDLLQ